MDFMHWGFMILGDRFCKWPSEAGFIDLAWPDWFHLSLTTLNIIKADKKIEIDK